MMDASIEHDSKIKIALIDDHEIVRAGLSSVICAEDDLQVISQCADAQEGLREILALKPDVAIVDVSMPGSSPFEMVQVALRAHPKLKVIFLSAYNTDSNVERAISSGASGFITKTESLSTIVNAIRDVVGGQSPVFSIDVRSRVVTPTSLGPGGQPAQSTSRKSLLSPREVEILCCVARGQSARQIATLLTISAKTVERHKSNIMTKLQFHTQVELTRYAIREGMINP